MLPEGREAYARSKEPEEAKETLHQYRSEIFTFVVADALAVYPVI